MAVFYTSDTYPILVFPITYDDGSGSVDLSSCTVHIDIVATGTVGVRVANNDLCAIVDAAGGICSYQLPQPLTLPPGVNSGDYTGQLTINYGGGEQQTCPPFTITVQRRLADS